ncbi:MAG: hypothetical protein IIX86_00315 [Clostridia bacterium]|nr:hypothetical protein [Clostridia bacterium]
MTIKKTSWMILLFLTALLLFSSCNKLLPDLADKQEDMADLMDCVIAEDKDAAMDFMELMPVQSQAQLDAFWNELLRIYDGAETYEIKFVSWNTTYSYTDQTQITDVVYQVKADTKATAEFRLVYNTNDFLYGINVTDITPKNTAVIITVRVLLIVYFLLTIAFCVWMMVDCIKRPIRLKVLWFILIWIAVLLQFSLVGTSLGFRFIFGLITRCGIIQATVSSFLLRIPVPVGALIYFFVRKKLKHKANKAAQQMPMETNADAVPEGTVNDTTDQSATDAQSETPTDLQEDPTVTQEQKSDSQTNE